VTFASEPIFPMLEDGTRTTHHEIISNIFNTQDGALMPDDTIPTLYCANHPDRETMLRCNKCDKPICFKCAVRTPVGYRCRECVRGQQAVYYTGTHSDLVIAGIVAIVLGGIFGALAYAFLGLIGLFSFIVAFFAGPAAGGAVAEVIRRAVNKRRARGMKWTAAALFIVGVFVGGLVLYGGQAFFSMSLGRTLMIVPSLFFRLDVLLATGLAASTIYARLL
jgi:hypothetical protein